MIEEIIEQYQNQRFSIEQICKYHKIGKLKVKQILTESNIPLKKKGGQIKHAIIVDFHEKCENKIIKCQKCGKEINDVENISGAAITHIKECYPEITIPTQYIRAQYKKIHGTYWHLQFFELLDKQEQKYFKCPLCDWTTTDLTNATGSITKHIEKKHGELSAFTSQFKEYEYLFNKFKTKELLENDCVICKICGEKMKVINNSHLRHKHNSTITEYKLRFPNSRIICNSTSNILKKNMIKNNENMTPVWSSSGELELKEFISSLGVLTDKAKNRKLLNGKEIDIIIPEHKLCIEYNGLYYHTESMGKTQSYHLSKTIECANIGYKLIHIFEDEWVKNKELTKNKLKHLLKLSNGIKIGARKVTIKRINRKEKGVFLNKNHIQGNDKSTIYYGAFYDKLLVGVMTFNSKRNMTKKTDNEFELSRFAVNQNYVVSGLGNKLLNHFINEYNPRSVISFADRRWTPDPVDNMYVKMGFELTKVLKPSYSYYNSKIDKYKRFHKFGFGKQSIKKRYPDLDATKSEKDLMKDMGFDRIWDCGLFKYVLQIKKEK